MDPRPPDLSRTAPRATGDEPPTSTRTQVTQGGPAGSASAVPVPHPPAPVQFGKFRILGALGRGGMGAVYRAEDPQLGRAVALKVLLPELSADPRAKARFTREARSQAAVEHDHIVAIHEVGEADGVAYIAMPLLKGQTLSAALKAARRPPLGEALRIAREMAEGLAAAHAAGLIHRDIKPGNVWLEDPRRRVKILDFGLARASDEVPEVGPAEPPSSSLVTASLPAPPEPQLTAAGAVMGTPAYMSPEQARGAPVDHRTDVFSLGVVLYQMATGERPFRGATTFELLAAVGSEEPLPPSALAPDVPPALDELVARLLAKNPADRPQTCAEVAEALDAIARGLAPLPVVVAVAPAGAPTVWEDLDSTEAEVPPATADAPPLKPVRAAKPARPAAQLGWKVWAGFTAAVAVSCALLGAAAWFLSRKPDPRPAPEVVKEELKPKPAPPPAAPDPHRELAKLILSKKGSVTVEGKVGAIVKEGDLPPGKFKVLTVSMHPPTTLPVADDELGAFEGIDSLIEVSIHGPNLSDDGIIKLLNQPFAPRLKSFQVSAPELTDRGAAALARCPALTALNFYSCPRLTDAGLGCLAAMPNLRRLNLGSAKLVTGAGLKHLKGDGLTELTAGHYCGLTDAAAPHLARCPQLTTLEISGTFTDETVIPLVKLAKLQKLSLTSPGVTDRGIEAVADLPSLSEFVVSGGGFTDAGVGHVGRMSRLTYLYLGGKVSDAGLDKLHGLKSLQKLQLEYATGFTPAGVRNLRAAVPACRVGTDLDQKVDRAAIEWVLKRGGTAAITGGVMVRAVKDLPATFELTGVILDKSAVPLTAADLDVLADCDRLRDLTFGPGVDDAVLKKLSGLPFAAQAHTLRLYQGAVTDDGLAALAAMPKLRNLILEKCPLTGSGLGVLRELPELRQLNLSGCPLTDGEVRHLRGLRLASLVLGGTRVTDAALDDLGTLTDLTDLNLHGVAVTDAAVPVLAGLKGLRRLDLRKTKVTREGVERLFEALPECAIDHDGGTTPAGVPVLQRPATRQALEWVLKVGGAVTVEVGGAEQAVKTLDGLPPTARLAALSFSGTTLKLPDGGKKGDELAQIAAGLKGLSAAAWSDVRAVLSVGYGLRDPAGWDALAAVPGLKPVTYVNFVGTGAPAVAPRLARFPRLNRVYFGGSDVGADELRALAALPGLRDLTLGQNKAPLTAAGVRELANVPLTRLTLSLTETPDEVLAALAELTAVKQFAFNGKTAPTAAQLKRLRAALPRCEILIDGKSFDGTPFERARPTLEWVLKVGGTIQVQVDGKALPALKSLDAVSPNARLVLLNFPAGPKLPAGPKDNWPEQVAVGLKDLPAAVWSDRLATLSIGHGASTAAGWDALAAVPGLEPVTELRYSHGAGDAGARAVAPRLAKFPQLRTVSFTLTDLGADELRALAALPKLRELTLAGSKPIPAAALGELAHAPLDKLTLYLTDAPDETLAALGRFTKVQHLSLITPKSAGLTDAQRRALRTALPGCEISIDSKPIPKTP